MIGAKPTITSHRATPLVQANAGEILDSFSDFRRRRWHPANFRGRSVSSALPCMSFHERVEGAAGTFQRGKVSVSITQSGNDFQKLRCKSPTYNREKLRSAQQAWMYSRNQTTIASASKHRQPTFLHPTRRSNGKARKSKGDSCGGAKCFGCFGAVWEVLRKGRSGFRPRATPAKRLNLLIRSSASTLQVFHFIGRFDALLRAAREPG